MLSYSRLSVETSKPVELESPGFPHGPCRPWRYHRCGSVHRRYSHRSKTWRAHDLIRDWGVTSYGASLGVLFFEQRSGCLSRYLPRNCQIFPGGNQVLNHGFRLEGIQHDPERVCFTCESEESTPAWIKLLNDANGHPKFWGSISTVISTLPELELAVWQVVFSAELLGSYTTPRTNWKQDRPRLQYVTISHNTRVSYDPKSCPTLDIYIYLQYAMARINPFIYQTNKSHVIFGSRFVSILLFKAMAVLTPSVLLGEIPMVSSLLKSTTLAAETRWNQVALESRIRFEKGLHLLLVTCFKTVERSTKRMMFENWALPANLQACSSFSTS